MPEVTHYVLLENYDFVTGQWWEHGEFSTYDEAVDAAVRNNLVRYLISDITKSLFHVTAEV